MIHRKFIESQQVRAGGQALCAVRSGLSCAVPPMPHFFVQSKPSIMSNITSLCRVVACACATCLQALLPFPRSPPASYGHLCGSCTSVCFRAFLLCLCVAVLLCLCCESCIHITSGRRCARVFGDVKRTGLLRRKGGAGGDRRRGTGGGRKGETGGDKGVKDGVTGEHRMTNVIGKAAQQKKS